LSRAAAVTGRNPASAVETRNTNNPGLWQVEPFTLSPEAARRSAHSSPQQKPGPARWPLFSITAYIPPVIIAALMILV